MTTDEDADKTEATTDHLTAATSPTSPTKIDEELAAIAAQHDGLVRAENVVEFAMNPATALHGQFPWDDRVAAHERRLDIARGIIRARVVYLPRQNAEPVRVRAYFSLPDDRLTPGGGYRTTVSILSDTERRNRLLAQALAELAAFKRKYAMLAELAVVFAAAEEVKAPIAAE